LYTQPATMTAARFIGTPPMNLLELEDSPDGAVIAGSEGPVVLPGAVGHGFCLGVRPEDIHLDNQRGLPAIVASSDYHGADTIIKAHAGGSEILVRLPGRYRSPVGEQIRLTWPADSVRLLSLH